MVWFRKYGAVGIALSGGPRPALQRAFPGLRAIAPPLEVTRWVSLHWFHEVILISAADQRVTLRLSTSWITETPPRTLSLRPRRA